jgi:hypothetical protein
MSSWRDSISLVAESGQRSAGKCAFCWMHLSLVDRYVLDACRVLRLWMRWVRNCASGSEGTLLDAYTSQLHHRPWSFIDCATAWFGSNDDIRGRVGLSEVNGVRVSQLSHVSQTGLGPCARNVLGDVSMSQSCILTVATGAMRCAACPFAFILSNVLLNSVESQGGRCANANWRMNTLKGSYRTLTLFNVAPRL